MPNSFPLRLFLRVAHGMSFCDVSLLCFEGCVNAINGFIEKGTEHHTRIAKARKRREGVDHHHDKNQLEIQWTVEFKEEEGC